MDSAGFSVSKRPERRFALGNELLPLLALGALRCPPDGGGR
jgi:hypothetical protein